MGTPPRLVIMTSSKVEHPFGFVIVYLKVEEPALVVESVMFGFAILVDENVTPALFPPIICHETVSPAFVGVFPVTE